VDTSTGSYVEDACKKENAGGEHRQDPEANRGGNTAKSVQSGIIIRLPGLKSQQQALGLCYQLKPRRVRGFLTAALFGTLSQSSFDECLVE